VIFFRGFLPLGFTEPSVNRKAAVLVLVCPGYFISPVRSISGEYSPIRHPGRHPMVFKVLDPSIDSIWVFSICSGKDILQEKKNHLF
jgi:hypothetical protein